MNGFKKTGIAVLIYSLAACGDSGSTATEAVTPMQKKETKTRQASPHSIQGMKKVMDDARGVEQLLQQHEAEQRKEIERQSR